VPTGIANIPPSGPIGPAGGGAGGGAPPRNVAAANNRLFVPDEVLVSFTASVQAQAIVNFAQGQRLALIGVHRLPLINTVLYRFRITDRRDVPAVVGSLRTDGRIAAVQPNYLYTLQDDGAPNAATGDPAQYVVSKLHLSQAHGLATGSHVLVAVIDSAIDAMHPELRGVIAGGFDTIKSQPLPHRHGTAMASAIAAHGRLLGVAPAAHILAVRAFDAAVFGAQATTTRLLDCLQWTSTSGARVVNMSFTGPADPKIHEMIAAARQKGLVLVAAAGNSGPHAPEAFPAAYPEVIAVTATDIDDKVFRGANHGRYVAVAAPGVEIFVAAPNGGYDFTTGTSVATAHVSGLAALLIERNPGLTPDAVQAILMRTAKDLGPKGRDDEYGAGLVDAYEAVLTQAPATAERTLAQ
jgi:subtilisin family serine protease